MFFGGGGPYGKRRLLTTANGSFPIGMRIKKTYFLCFFVAIKFLWHKKYILNRVVHVLSLILCSQYKEIP